jgi:hypothetical protein
MLVGIIYSRGIPRDESGMKPAEMLKKPVCADGTINGELEEKTGAVRIAVPNG